MIKFNPRLCRNEREVESKFIVHYLLPELGYRPETWYQEVACGSIRLDFMAFAAYCAPFVSDGAARFTLVIEAKHPREKLDRHVRKLKYYLSSLRVRYGLLTNAKEVRIYERCRQDMMLIFSCPGEDVVNHMDKLRSLVGRDGIRGKSLSGKKDSDDRGHQIRLAETQEKIILRPVSEEKCTGNSEASDSPNEQEHTPRRPARAVPRISSNPTVKEKYFENKGKDTMKIITVYHNKGGVGKTTAVVNLAAALSRKGKQVLVIDLDSQANTTYATGLIKFADEEDDNIKDRNILHVLRSEDLDPIEEVARKSQFSSHEIDVVPSHIDLMQAELDLTQEGDVPFILVDKLKAVEKMYDIAILDTPPSLNLYARSAVIAADYLIIPSDLKPFANQGLANVKDFIKKNNSTRKHIGKGPIRLLGVLPSKISTHPQFVKHSLPKRIEKIPKIYGIQVMESRIFEREDLAKCTEDFETIAGQEIPNPSSVFDYKPHSQSAEEFETLAEEVMRKIGVAE